MGSSVEKILNKMENNQTVTFTELFKVCEFFFGEPRQNGSSHTIFKTPWLGDPRINIQNNKGQTKPYQVKQVLTAINKLREIEENL